MLVLRRNKYFSFFFIIITTTITFVSLFIYLNSSPDFICYPVQEILRNGGNFQTYDEETDRTDSVFLQGIQPTKSYGRSNPTSTTTKNSDQLPLPRCLLKYDHGSVDDDTWVTSEFNAVGLSNEKIKHYQSFMKKMRFHVVQQYFIPKEPQRKLEYDFALNTVLSNPSVLQVHLLLSNEEDWLHIKSSFHDPQNKFLPCYLGNRITYRSSIAYINKFLSKELVIMNNADIIFYKGLEEISEEELDSGVVMSPIRWNPPECGTLSKCSCDHYFNDWGGCADSFIFRAPLKNVFLLDGRVDFEFGGRLGGDNVFIYELTRFGYNVTNPCLSVMLLHSHCSDLRPLSYDVSRRITKRCGLSVPSHGLGLVKEWS